MGGDCRVTPKESTTAATIKSARLSLHADTTSTLYGQGIFNGEVPGHSTLSGSNAFSIYPVLAPWDESTVTWSNQPALDLTAPLKEPASQSFDQNYADIDVTQLVQGWAWGTPNFGIAIDIDDKTSWRAIQFASSDHPNSAWHPELVVEYEPGIVLGICSVKLDLQQQG